MTTQHDASNVPGQSKSVGSFPAHRALRKLVVVSRDFLGQRVLERIADGTSFDIVFVESTANAYSLVKRITPNLVIVCLEIDDPEAFHVLSMLNLDNATSRIPVITYMTTRESGEAEADPDEPYQGVKRQLMALGLTCAQHYVRLSKHGLD